MKILLFGATGLAGSGVLRACLDVAGGHRSARGRAAIDRRPRSEAARDPFTITILDYSAIADEFAGVDACFFCLGVSVSQVPDEADYRRIHQAFPLAAARLLRERSPTARFHYLSGGSAGLKSRWMWARVKAEAERDLMAAFDAHVLASGDD